MGVPQPDTGSVTEDTGVVGGLLTANGDVDFNFLSDAGQWTPQTISGLYGSSLTIDADGVWTYTASNANASIQALDTGDTLTEVFTVTASTGTTTVTITINGLDEPPCFVSGTLIDTPQGPRPVESLVAGDEVITRDSGVQRVQWAGVRHVDLQDEAYEAFQPVRLRKNCFAPGVPERDILVSPMHRVLVRNPMVELITGQSEVLCAAKNLVNNQTILRESVAQTSYHHLLFEAHEVLFSSGCESESFYPGALGLDGFEEEAREDVFTLFPELRSLPNSYGATARHVAKRHEATLLQGFLCPQQRLEARLEASGQQKRGRKVG